jgi:hypothetical protein
MRAAYRATRLNARNGGAAQSPRTEGRALPGIKAVGIVSGLMEAETARPTVTLNAANHGHYGEQKHS